MLVLVSQLSSPLNALLLMASDARGWAVACVDPRTSKLRYVVQHFNSSRETCFEDGRRASIASAALYICFGVLFCVKKSPPVCFSRLLSGSK